MTTSAYTHYDKFFHSTIPRWVFLLAQYVRIIEVIRVVVR